MEICFAPLFSGSSGNSTYVGTSEGGILIDAGVSAKRLMTAAASMGIDPKTLGGILVTHEHSDHIAGIRVLAKNLDVPIYATEGTWQGMADKVGEIPEKNRRIVTVGENFYINGMEIMAYPTPHDSLEPCGYTFERRGARFALATDLGCIKDSWLKHVQGADAVILESNYDLDMLLANRYPFTLKARIKGRKGHLSNEDCATVAVKLAETGTKQLFLGHLSKESNFPQLAYTTTNNMLALNGIYTDSDMGLRVCERDEPTGLFAIESKLY